MYALYLKENLRLITFLSVLNDPNNAEYEKPIYANIPVSMDVFFQVNEQLSQEKEIIVKDGAIQEMYYTTELVKYLVDAGYFFKKDTYAKITDYDFRLEGETYEKTAEDDPNYLLYLQGEEFKKAKENKIAIANKLFNDINIEIVNVENNEVVDTFRPSTYIAGVFSQGISFEETPFEFFKISNNKQSIFLPNSSLQTLETETNNMIQYMSTNFLRNQREINKLATIEEINNYVIKAGINLNEDIVSKVKVIVKLVNNEFTIMQVKKIAILGINQEEVEI